MSPSKKKLLKKILIGNIGSCGCSNLKTSQVYDPKPRPRPETKCNNNKPPHLQDGACEEIIRDDHDHEREGYNTSTTISCNMDKTATTSSSSTTVTSESEADRRRARGLSSKISNSIAVVKDSDDPCKDFKDSMMQMVVQKQMYSRCDLEQLLNCFLELNSPCHYRLIIQAFSEIWNEVMASPRIGNYSLNNVLTNQGDDHVS